MAGILLRRDARGRFRLRLQGCCGNLDRWQREYEQAFLEQVVRDGGRVEQTDAGDVVATDRQGKRHRVDATGASGRS